MAGDLDLLARLLAYRDGRAYPRASHRHVSIQPDALVLAPLALAGEDTTIHIVAYGPIGRPPRLLCVPDPRQRDDQYRLFAELGADIEDYFRRCRDAGRFPQIWVSSAPVAAHLDTLADRLRYNRLDPAIKRFGELLSYATGRLPVAGQQALLTATGVLALHWATGQQDGEDEHLGALLTWLEPPPGRGILAAVAAAELEPMGVKTDPDFDRDELAPLVGAYNAAARAGAAPAALRARARLIRDALAPVARRIYAATQRAVALLRDSGRPPLPDLPAMDAREAAEFEGFMAARDAAIPLALRDSPKAAAFGLAGREHALETAETAVLRGDRVARARGRLSGRVLLGEVENPRSTRTGPRRVAYGFDVRSRQRVLHLRRRDELCWVDDPRLRVVVEDVRRDGGATRVSVRLLAGQRAVGLPTAGATLELVEPAPTWDDIWRVRGHLKTVLAATPWTHADGGIPAPAPPAAPPVPDPLAAVEALR
ncbi:MAG: hypothetical protein IT340_22360 [Chloroflexi bacterium]|nr:hypothetical protein [Chloroflexota bacterium]